MQSAMVSHRFVLGIIALGVSFGLSLVLTWDFRAALLTGIITITVTYTLLFIEQRQRHYEMRGRKDSLQRIIQELEVLKKRVVEEINQLETYYTSLQRESNQLQNQIGEHLNQRETFQREVSNLSIEKKQIERQIYQFRLEIDDFQTSKDNRNNELAALNKEKRSLDINCNLAKAEITQLQSQIYELQQQQQDLESNLTLLERLRPQLEEKLYEMRVQLQKLELQENNKSECLGIIKTDEKNILETSFTTLEDTITQQKTEVNQLQEKITILQTERDQLQNQVLELLQQFDNIAQVPTNYQANKPINAETELFPFADLIEDIDSTETEDELSTSWNQLLQKLLSHEVEVLKVILKQDNVNKTIKKIAEDKITMPSLLIDSINEKSNTIFGELIIEFESESPTIPPEYQNNVSNLINVYDILNNKGSSSN
ncbi:MAG: hypothetical protein HRU34_06485 [Richelia sp.]|nr:hypothetical protein [Richelia sp.]